MKKIVSFLLMGCMILGLAACSPDNPDNSGGGSNVGGQQGGKPPVEEEMLEYDKYTLETYTKPFWDSKYMYNETMMFVGKDDTPCMLFEADEVISVRSYDLQTEYVENVDYIIQDNCIMLTENTRIPYFTEDEYYPTEYIKGAVFGCTRSDKNYILFGEGDTFCKKQIAVTYKHTSRYTGPIIEDMSDRFQMTLAKLNAGFPVNVVFYGDSITTGANSSGIIGVGPYAESFPEMVTSWLKANYPNSNITYTNTAVGGMNTQWGIDNVSTRVNAYSPDIVFIGFGMNDPNLSSVEYRAKVEQIIAGIRNASEDTEIMLVSMMLPNKEVTGFYGNQYLFETELASICETYENVGLAPVTMMHDYVLKTKRYYDMTGNNVNHPSDFLARIYAQTILRAFMGDKYSSK